MTEDNSIQINKRLCSSDDDKRERLESRRKYYQTHKKQIAERSKKYRQANKELIAKQKRKYSREHREENRKYHRKYYKQTRIKLMKILGGVKCVLCNMDVYDLLHFDHINGGGIKDRLRFNRNFYTMYKYYIVHPNEARAKLRVLCAGCNWQVRNKNRTYDLITTERTKVKTFEAKSKILNIMIAAMPTDRLIRLHTAAKEILAKRQTAN